jgi:hypothetical protein
LVTAVVVMLPFPPPFPISSEPAVTFTAPAKSLSVVRVSLPVPLLVSAAPPLSLPLPDHT